MERPNRRVLRRKLRRRSPTTTPAGRAAAAPTWGSPKKVAAAAAECGRGRWTQERLRVVEAQERLRVAEALERLPRMKAALGAGELVWPALRELTRVATPESEAQWLEVAAGPDDPPEPGLVRVSR